MENGKIVKSFTLYFETLYNYDAKPVESNQGYPNLGIDDITSNMVEYDLSRTDDYKVDAFVLDDPFAAIIDNSNCDIFMKSRVFETFTYAIMYNVKQNNDIINNIDINDHTEDNLNKVVSLIISESANVSFIDKQVIYKGHDIWPILSSQEAGNNAALISFYPPLRYAIRDFQRGRINLPGLVAEGRDMATAVFTDSHAKIYLDASVEARAKRRLKDEERRNSGKTYEMICEELRKRDETDKAHVVGALTLAPDAFYIDTSEMTIDEVLEECVEWCRQKGIAL